MNEAGPDSGATASYALAAHASCCLTTECVVILDLKADKYLAVELRHSDKLAAAIRGWPASPNPDASADEEETREVMRDLLERGLLTTYKGLEDAAFERTSELPRLELLDCFLASEVRPTIREAATFLYAVRSARRMLAQYSLEELVRRVAARRTQSTSTLRGAPPEVVRHLVGSFIYLRPFAYSGRAHCMLDALVLINYLAFFGIFPRWIFGVHMVPFQAHCWVQSDDVVYNDTPEHVRQYTAILAV